MVSHRIILQGAFSLLFLAAFSSCASHGHKSQLKEAMEIGTWVMPTPPEKIAGPIHYVGTKGLAAYLITTPKGHILIDGSTKGCAKQVEASIREIGYRPEDIKFLLPSHAHFDHVGSLAYFKKLTGAQVVIMEGDEDLLASGGKSDFFLGRMPLLRFDPVEPDRVIRDGETVTLGGITLLAHHTPGHTRGSVTYTTTIRDSGHRYRVVFGASTTILPGMRVGGKNPSYPGITADFRRTFAILESLKPDIYLSNHANFFDFDTKRQRAKTEGAKAYVDPEGYRRQVAEEKAKFEKKLAKFNPP